MRRYSILIFKANFKALLSKKNVVNIRLYTAVLNSATKRLNKLGCTPIGQVQKRSFYLD